MALPAEPADMVLETCPALGCLTCRQFISADHPVPQAHSGTRSASRLSNPEQQCRVWNCVRSSVGKVKPGSRCVAGSCRLRRYNRKAIDFSLRDPETSWCLSEERSETAPSSATMRPLIESGRLQPMAYPQARSAIRR